MTKKDEPILPSDSMPAPWKRLEAAVQPGRKAEPDEADREWLPEDDDEWYEPDYCRADWQP